MVAKLQPSTRFTLYCRAPVTPLALLFLQLEEKDMAPIPIPVPPTTKTTMKRFSSVKGRGRILPILLWCAVLWTRPHVCQGKHHSGPRSLTLLSGIFGFGSDNKEEPQQSTTPLLASNSSHSSSHRPPPPVTAAQGFGRSASASLPPHLRNRDSPYPESSSSSSTSDAPRRPPPPPPPPPLPGRAIAETTTSSLPVEVQDPENNDDSETATNLPPPPPPLPQWGLAVPPQAAVQPPQQPPPQQQQGWMMRPPPGQYDDNNNSWDNSGAYYGGGDHPDYYLRAELDESLAREGDLIAQMDNLTAAIVYMEQREELHMRQLDVLTERVMDVEAQAAQDRNLLALYEANCTALGQAMGTLQEEVESWQQRCNEFAERHEADQETLKDLKRQIKEKQSEAEDLAIAIENVRLAERRREASQSRKTSRRGVFSWFLSFFVSEDSDYDESMRDEAFEMAKSTLLRALQTERGNVNELEAAVMSLQQNNSAISEMVESRDSIIDELNNRIAVFEEDKVVLKAALRQLQKEIKEEAPKAQKLLDDLSKAEQEIKRLKSEMHSIIETHQEEIMVLQQTISSKQQAISETESNLTAIGTYVDKLEERLTSFAVTRRDMEEREKKCKEIEEAAIVTENERKALQVKVDEYAKQEEEVKKLLEELAAERTTLQKENRKLYTEREFRIAEQEQLRTKCSSLENETQALQMQLDEWKTRSDNLLPELEATRSAAADLQARLKALEAVEKEFEATKLRCSDLEVQLNQTIATLEAEKAEKQTLDELARNQTLRLAEFEKKETKVDEVQKVPENPHGPKDERNVPFRKIRKQLSKATGIHGLLTPPSKPEPSKKRIMPPTGKFVPPTIPPPPIRPGRQTIPQESST